MNPVPTPHDDALDQLIAAAIHGELTPEERAAFDARLQAEPAARAAYQEAQAMHDLLEKTHAAAQPEPDFEQRMVSGVRRKLKTEPQTESAWQSLVLLWSSVRNFFAIKKEPTPAWRYLTQGLVLLGIIAVLSGVALGPITNGIKQSPRNAELQRQRMLEMAKEEDDSQAQIDAMKTATPQAMPRRPTTVNGNIDMGATTATTGGVVLNGGATTTVATTDSTATAMPAPMMPPAATPPAEPTPAAAPQAKPFDFAALDAKQKLPDRDDAPVDRSLEKAERAQPVAASAQPMAPAAAEPDALRTLADANASPAPAAPTPAPAQTAAAPAAIDTRKLIRNAQLDLEVKSYQAATDAITVLTKEAGGYVDTSHSQKGGNGKLQGTVVVKVLPQNLDAFLLKLRDLGELTNQSVSTDDVTKDYFDTTARLVNSQKMEAQLQDLLKRENGKVSDLLTVERELARVRGDIEQMQGQLKLYDFQVQYATVTIDLREKDLNQAAAYLLKEQDDFSLFATDVESAFQQARHAADTYKAQILQANLNHNSGSDVSAELVVLVAPEQIEPFLDQVRALGRVANFTRQTQRVAKDGGDTSQPADQTLTERDKVKVHLSIRYDNTTATYLLKEQDDFSLFATDVESAFQKARGIADDFKAQVLLANLTHNSGTDVSAELAVTVAPDQIEPFLGKMRELGRVANFTRQTQRITKDAGATDQAGGKVTTEKDKVQVHVAFRSDDESRKQVALTVVAKAVDDALDQAKSAALAHDGVEILSSSLNKAPQGQSTAHLSVRIPGKDYAAVMEAFKALGRTASLSIQRNDDSGPGASGDDVPVIVALSLTDDDTPMQQTQLTVRADDVDAGEQQIKKAAAAAGVEVKASSFERQPDGTEFAQMTFRLPMGKYAAFLESVKALGKVESLTVRRDDRPDQAVSDDAAPADIQLQLHNQRDIVAANDGLFATLRQTFGEGAAALFGSIRVIGVLVAFALPWAVAGVVAAWVTRRIYVWRKNRPA